MVRKTKKQKIHRKEKTLFSTSIEKLGTTESSARVQKSILTKEEQLTNTYFIADFKKSFLIISAIIIAEVALYYTNFAHKLLGK